MERIESRTTPERIMRTSLLALFVSGFAAAFLWDGNVRYPRKNAEAFAVAVGADGGADFPIDSRLTAERAADVGWALPTTAVRTTRTSGVGSAVRTTRTSDGRVGTAHQRTAHHRQVLPPGSPVADILTRLGEPALRQKDSVYFLGRAGYLEFRLRGDRLVNAQWVNGPYSETDLRWQCRIGYALAVAGIAALYHLARVLTMRVSVTDAGLRVSGKPLIPFDAITVLRTTDAEKRPDAVAVEYVINGRAGSVKLDSYVVRDLPGVVAALRERAGFPHPE